MLTRVSQHQLFKVFFYIKSIIFLKYFSFKSFIHRHLRLRSRGKIALLLQNFEIKNPKITIYRRSRGS